MKSFFSKLTNRRSLPLPVIPLDPLDQPLIHFSQSDSWRIRDSFEGTQIFGATGSGKTSGSGQYFAKSFLRAGYGGLVLTAKPDERALWQRYARETGRSESLLIFSPSERWRFNFLDAEFRRPGAGAGITENLVQVFTTVFEAGERSQGQGGSQDYWARTTKQLLRNAIDLAAIGQGRVSLDAIYDIVVSAPTSPEETGDVSWQDRSACMQCIRSGETRPKSGRQSQDFALTVKFWLQEWPNLASRTRSIILSSFTSMADTFLRGTLAELFGTNTNFVPEFTHAGAVIVMDLPVLEFGQVGQFAQVLFKYIWQRATERRNITRHSAPVFLWADESQYFVTAHDAIFQSTARSARAATVYLTQNLPNYLAVVGGGANGHAAINSLMGNLATKIFHANTCSQTNEWASQLIAKNWHFRGNVGSSTRDVAMGTSHTTRNYGGSDALDYEVLPREFTTLRKGGPEADHQVEGIVFQSGRIWEATDTNNLKVRFKQ